MRLFSFRIKNFKSINDTKECKLSADDNILVLAGQNEAGKSSILEGLDFFWNGASDDFERLHRRRDESPEVECTFLLSEKDIDNIFIESNENVVLKKYFEKNKNLTFVRGDIEQDDFDEIKFSKGEWSKLSALFEEVKKTSSSAVAPAPSAEAGVKAEAADNVEEFTVEKLQEFLICEVRRFNLFTSFRDLLPGVVKVSDLKKYPAIKDFETIFSVNFADVVKWDPRSISREEDRIRKEATANMNQYWQQTLEEGGQYNFSVKITKKDPVVESQIEFRIDRNDGDPLYMEHKSQGFKWFSAFHLRLRALAEEKITIENLVILIDEPGQGLHERAQLDVKKVLEELANKGAQIIYSTHYPNLIGTEGREFMRIRLVSNSQAGGTRIDNPAQYASRSGSKDALMPLVKAMGLTSIKSVLDTDTYNIIVEGIADHYYLSAFKNLLSKNPRFYFVPACGATQVINIVKIFIGWRVPYKAIVDDDKEGRIVYNSLKNQLFEKDDVLAHEHVLKLSGMEGVEDLLSREDFCKFVLDKPADTASAKTNSQLAEGKKELLGRMFLSRVEKSEVTLSKESQKNINQVFQWLDEKFKTQS